MLNQVIKDHAFRTLLVVLALIGILITRQYGKSWDELKLYDYASNSLEAYMTSASAWDHSCHRRPL